jgi:hypothetical protein
MQHANTTCIYVHHGTLLPTGSANRSLRGSGCCFATACGGLRLATHLTFRLTVTTSIAIAMPMLIPQRTAIHKWNTVPWGASSTHACMHAARADLRGHHRGCQSRLHDWLPRTSSESSWHCMPYVVAISESLYLVFRSILEVSSWLILWHGGIGDS